MTALREAGTPMTPKEILIAAELRNRNATDILLGKMVRDSEIVRAERGCYRLSNDDPGKNAQKERSSDQAADLADEIIPWSDLSNLSRGGG